MSQESKTLAERCFNRYHLEVELHEALCGILEVGHMDGVVDDVVYDDYDGSIEIVLPSYYSPMTDEQRSKIRELGFGSVYEHIGEREFCNGRERLNKHARKPRDTARLQQRIWYLERKLKEAGIEFNLGCNQPDAADKGAATE